MPHLRGSFGNLQEDSRRELAKMFQSFFNPFQVLLRYQARGLVCFQSSPFGRIANSSARIVTLRTPSDSGQ
jgi:hypothetical protein